MGAGAGILAGLLAGLVAVSVIGFWVDLLGIMHVASGGRWRPIGCHSCIIEYMFDSVKVNYQGKIQKG